MAIFAKKSKLLCAIILLCAASLTTPANAKSKHHTHKAKHHARAGVDRSAGYADIVIDAESGQILHATNADALRHPASLTKMMTLYLTFQALESGRVGLNTYLPISANAAEQSPSKLGLHAGQRIRLEDAILGLVTESANDAAVVLAEWLGGSEKGFAQLMTRQARALGMSHTNFDNPSGLPDDAQITTARDMAILGHSLIYHYPQFYPYFSHDSFTYAGVYHHNHNHLMDRYEGMDGIKTGYIRASGFNLVASAVRSHVRLIGVVFGGRSTTARDNRMALLLDEGFALEQKQKTKGHNIENNAQEEQGDSSDNDGAEVGGYVTLPAKVSVVFAPATLTNPHQTSSSSRASGEVNPTEGNAMASKNWGVQIGAFSDASTAQQALVTAIAQMPQLLGTSEPQIQKLDEEGQAPVYRARLMALEPKTAQAACVWLVQHRYSCLTVGP